MKHVDAARRIAQWGRDPKIFVREAFGATPDDWQDEGLDLIASGERTGFCASKGPGKTCLLAWTSWWFLLTRLHPNIAAVSITIENLRDGLWKEMAHWQMECQLLMDQFEITKTRIYAREFPDTWWMAARSFSKTGGANEQALALAGLHKGNLMFVLDEVGGIPDAVMATAEAGLATEGDTKIVMAGNPTHLTGPLYRACTTQGHLWNMVNINSDPDNPKRSKRVSSRWAQEQIDQFGRDNPWVLVNVFGQFPPSSINALLGPEEVEAAQKRAGDEAIIGASQRRIGVDTARFGDDRTVIFKRAGLMSYPPITLRNADSLEIAMAVSREAADFAADIIFVDDTGGYGAGAIDMLIAMGITPIPVNFAGKANDSRYFNKRSEMWFELAEWVKRGGVLAPGNEILRELSTATYSYQKGKFRLEDKNQIKQRLGHSPDEADALALTFAVPDSTIMRDMLGNVKHPKLKYDYNPIGDDRT